MVELNDLQKAIVETQESKVLVMSSVAVGKTHCLTERLKYILEHGADPSKVVCITFTNAAAIEMKKELETIHLYSLELFMLIVIVYYLCLVMILLN